jgi:hypothetical protein
MFSNRSPPKVKLNVKSWGTSYQPATGATTPASTSSNPLSLSE